MFTALMFRARWVKVQGTEYREECAVLIAITDDYPVFARVEGIYVIDNNRVLFDVCILQTCTFCEHYHVYLVRSTHMHRLMHIEELHHQSVFCIRQVTIDGCTKLAIIPKYHLTGTLQ